MMPIDIFPYRCISTYFLPHQAIKFSGHSRIPEDSFSAQTRPGKLPEFILKDLDVSPEIRRILEARENGANLPAPCLGEGRRALEILLKNPETLYAHGTNSVDDICLLKPAIAHPQQAEKPQKPEDRKLGYTLPDGTLIIQKVPKVFLAPLKYMDFPIFRASLKDCGRHSVHTLTLNDGSEISLYGAYPDTRKKALKQLAQGVTGRVYIVDGKDVGFDFHQAGKRIFPLQPGMNFSLANGEFTAEKKIAPIGYIEVSLADLKDYQILKENFFQKLPDQVVPGMHGFKMEQIAEYLKSLGINDELACEVLDTLRIQEESAKI